MADRLRCTAVTPSVKQVALIIELLSEQTRLQIQAFGLADKIPTSICIGEAIKPTIILKSAVVQPTD